MVDFVKKHGFNVYSQNGEDGIIKECLKRMNKTTGTACEFGAADGFFCSNTANLKEWSRIIYDVNPTGDVKQAEITPENVNDLVPGVDLLSIDIDGNDYNVWKAYKGKPAIVIIEINSSYPPEAKVINFQGTSYTPMVQLGISKDYFLLCHTGNLVFVDRKYKKLFPEITGDPLTDTNKYFNKAWLPAKA